MSNDANQNWMNEPQPQSHPQPPQPPQPEPSRVPADYQTGAQEPHELYQHQPQTGEHQWATERNFSSGPEQTSGQFSQDDYYDNTDQFETVDSDNSSKKKVKRIIFGSVYLVLAVLGFFVYSWFSSNLKDNDNPGQAITLEIPDGASTKQISNLLEENGVVGSSFFFENYVRFRASTSFQAGTYELGTDLSVPQAIEALKQGPQTVAGNLTQVIEGLWVEEILPQLDEQLPNVTAADLQAVLDTNAVQPKYRPAGVTSWEGLLFPESYDFPENFTAEQVVQRMNDELVTVATELGIDDPAKRRGYTEYEILIIASLIQSEALHDADRPKVARVIYNRLENPDNLETFGLLQIDAALLFGANDRKQILTTDFIESFDNPYNSYRFQGLPPTPISVPGRASIEAALNPAEGDELYYVVKDAEGNHLFTSVYDDFINQKNASKAAGYF